jgi:hypothetical protein
MAWEPKNNPAATVPLTAARIAEVPTPHPFCDPSGDVRPLLLLEQLTDDFLISLRGSIRFARKLYFPLIHFDVQLENCSYSFGKSDGIVGYE